MLKYALLSWLLMGLIFMSCSQVTNEPKEPPVEESLSPIIQIADTLKGSKGQAIEFHILDYFESKVPIVNSALFSEELQITPLPNDSFRVAQPYDSTGLFSIAAELINEDAYELSAELIYFVPQPDTIPPTPANIYQVKNAVNGQQGERITLDVTEYFKSEVPIDSVAFQAEQVTVTFLNEYQYEFSQPDDLFGEVEISIFLRNTDQQTLVSSLIYDIEKAPEPAPITQQKSVIEGQQGETVEIYIGDYFKSEVNFTSTVLYSEEITVDSLGDGRFRLSQPGELFGEFRIQAFITNSDDITLEAELMYQIEENSDVPSDEVLIIMPLGDSMTNDSRSRVKLWNLLSDDGHDLDYVGNQYQESSIPDPDHEGVGGIEIEGIMDKAESLMQTHSPRYVALMVGTNDIAWYFDEPAPEIADRWNDLVDRIFYSSGPGTYILAATIPPVSPKIVGKSGMPIQDRAVMVQQYNAELRSYIKARKANGDHIILADMEAALDPGKHVSSDGVHLNEVGFAIMGTVYYDAMNKALKEQE